MTVVATLCFLLRGDEVLLIRKKRGFGAGKLNGVGGRVETGEVVESAAAREVLEEVGVIARSLQPAGVLEFYSTGGEPDWVIHVFLCRVFESNPRPSDEAEPRWFKVDELPYSEMWDDDRVWLPHVLAGRRVRGKFWFNEGYTKLLKWELGVG